MPESENHLHYLRHKNGGGKIFDISEACEKTFVCPRSEIRDASSVWQSKITGSKITQESVITNSVIRNSTVLASTVTGGIIENSLISCELVQGNVRIAGCQVLGKSRIAHSAYLRNASFKNLTVKGNAQLLDWHNDEAIDFHHGYCSRGVWRRPPRVFRVSETITITESVSGFAFVHCREFPIEHWLRVGNRYGKACNWTPEEILTARKIFHLLLKEQKY